MPSIKSPPTIGSDATAGDVRGSVRSRAAFTHARTAVLAIVLAAAALGTVACTSPLSPPDTAPSIRGVVTQAAQDGNGAVLVVWGEELGVEKAEYDAASVRLAEGGVVLIDKKRADLDSLQKGDLVEAWFEGPVAESYPVQAGASHVLATGSFDGPLPTPPGLESPLEQPE